jgi:hypothetical protein
MHFPDRKITSDHHSAPRHERRSSVNSYPSFLSAGKVSKTNTASLYPQMHSDANPVCQRTKSFHIPKDITIWSSIKPPIPQHNPLFRLKKGFCSPVFSEILYALRRKLQKQRSWSRRFFAIRHKNRKSTGAGDGIFDGFLRQ